MKSIILPIFIIFIINSLSYPQTISVDMIPGVDGIQDTLMSVSPGEEFIVEIIGSGFTAVSGYQFKLVFDSSKLVFLGGDADYGLSGKKNILKANGGAITGIFQRQANPQCDSILDVAFAINGINDLSVSGEGLLGIVQFRSKMAEGEYCSIRITEGLTAGFSGEKSDVVSYLEGTGYRPPSVRNTLLSFKKNVRDGNLAFMNNTISFQLQDYQDTNAKARISLYNLSGKLVAELYNGVLNNGRCTISLDHLQVKMRSEVYLCSLCFENTRYTVKVIPGR